jgi:hypothetical protein
MLRSILPVFIVFALAGQSFGTVQDRKPLPPPKDQDVLKAIALPPGVGMNDVALTKESIRPGQWQCVVVFKAYLELPGGRVVDLGRWRTRFVLVVPAS